jgi:predicted nucleic acid-binding protein
VKRQPVTLAICVDSSVWIEHFRGNTTRLQTWLERKPTALLTHELILLELALGGIASKKEKLDLISNLGFLPNITSNEMLRMVAAHDLAGKGIGCVDSHILASCMLTGTLLWTNDRKLGELADSFGLQFKANEP